MSRSHIFFGLNETIQDTFAYNNLLYWPQKFWTITNVISKNMFHWIWALFRERRKIFRLPKPKVIAGHSWLQWGNSSMQFTDFPFWSFGPSNEWFHWMPHQNLPYGQTFAEDMIHLYPLIVIVFPTIFFFCTLRKI